MNSEKNFAEILSKLLSDLQNESRSYEARVGLVSSKIEIILEDWCIYHIEKKEFNEAFGTICHSCMNESGSW